MIKSVKPQKDGVYAVTMEDGKTYYGVRERSRFWAKLQEWLASNTPDPAETAQETKDRLYDICNSKTESLIQSIMPDWMDRRHREQKDLVTRGKRPNTKLSERIWEANQEACDVTRDASDIVTDQIENGTLTTEDEVLNHTVWP